MPPTRQHDVFIGVLDQLEISIGTGWNAEDFCGAAEDDHRVLVCPNCNQSGGVYRIEPSKDSLPKKDKYSCSFCKSEFRRPKVRKAGGPSIMETISRKLGLTQPERSKFSPRLFESILGNTSQLSYAARVWIAFSELSISRGSKEAHNTLLEQLYFQIPGLPDLGMNDLCEKSDEAFELGDIDRVREIEKEIENVFDRRKSVVKAVIMGCTRMYPMPDKASLARIAGVNRSQFSSGRGWASIRPKVVKTINELNEEINYHLG